ncbi:response regulator [Pelagicoccus sp. SDUM812002]|uniref:response regulator n=1 Tax=Pelagicoccus sp. SDUM812002 TaxID=3041266 RepID=UPI00280FF522|nr:response regulator [Pelagicoccus sp. SDUM812002]MDQ8188143.1 response regulator [Pelagicoccus sp. SDUM812002]
MQSAPKGAILIIDDEEGIRAVLQAILNSIDIETLEASDAKSALSILADNKDTIAACMLDMNLEDSYGEDLYDKLRLISPDIKVFAMSGIFGEEIKERLGDRQIAGLISKPFSTAQLIETVQAGLEG